MILLSAFSLDAQQAATQEAKVLAGGIRVTSADAMVSWEKKLAEVEFRRASIEEVIGYLREEFSAINFVSSQQALDIPVTLHLRNVRLEEIMDAITFATDGQVRFDPSKENLVAVQARAIRTSKPVLKAYSLHRYLDGKSKEEADKAIMELQKTLEVSWAMLQGDQNESSNQIRPSLSIHENTKVLIAVGQPAQLEAIEEIINALQGSFPSRAGTRGGYGGGGYFQTGTEEPQLPAKR